MGKGSDATTCRYLSNLMSLMPTEMDLADPHVVGCVCGFELRVAASGFMKQQHVHDASSKPSSAGCNFTIICQSFHLLSR